jgi:hypothetical protein
MTLPQSLRQTPVKEQFATVQTSQPLKKQSTGRGWGVLVSAASRRLSNWQSGSQRFLKTFTVSLNTTRPLLAL